MPCGMTAHVHSAATPSGKSPWVYLDVSFSRHICLGIVSLQILRAEGFSQYFSAQPYIHSCQCSNANILLQTDVRFKMSSDSFPTYRKGFSRKKFIKIMEMKKIPVEAMRKLPQPMNLIKIVPESFDYLDSDLKKEGFASRQHMELR